ncbi:MAG: CDP-alcohol phosphatidyltransferase family protein [Melioribacteraceae bacterium]|nr:CDP-alcohol phosphatidyltransferase family protein [Melioribacteraceae bacterium]
MTVTLPNTISILRVLLLLPIYYVLGIESTTKNGSMLSVIVLFSFLLDIINTFLLRQFNKKSDFLKIFDPLSDNIFIGVLLFLLLIFRGFPENLFWIFIGREIILVLISLYIKLKSNLLMPPNRLGRLTMVMISSYIFMFILEVPNESLILQLLYYFSLVTIILSAVGYVIRASDILKWYKINGISE